ncbi:LacI family DNA-binding transcriptional regulator [Kribbella catacumbae]|uniref:LacI family DNA-binding transcriptional regulator n=1 Tax=Kribbella catacumbae TaxID=460086 RepID=UPI0003A0E1EE|nr:LacI family DNA-binding transcriptional regulator [Kribbella catacumbae]
MARRRSGQPGIVTLQDVATAAGVSRSTASRAFSRPDLLLPETVDRIHSIAHRMGYSLNHAARALSTGRFGNLAVIVPDIGNPFFPPLVRKIEAGADTVDYAVFLGDSDESAVREATLVARLSNQIDGLVLASSRMTEDQIRAIAATKPVVLINRDLAGIARVLVDVKGGVTEAVGHLKRLGHTDIAYVAGPRESWSEQQRRQSVVAAGTAAGLTVTVLELGRPSHEAARDIVSALVDSGATAVIAFDDVVAQGLLAGLDARGIDVPREFSVVGCDDILAATTQPPLTTISGGSAAAGEAAVELLLRLIDGHPAAGDERVSIGTHLVVRASVGRVNRRR